MLSWHFALFLLAAHFALFDKNNAFLRKTRVWFHNFTSPPEKQLETLDYGWVYNQNIRSRLFIGTIFATVVSIIFSILSSEFTLVMEVIFLFTKLVVVVTGFYALPIFEKLYSFFGYAVEKIEEVESGKNTVSGIVSEVTDQISDVKVEKSNSKIQTQSAQLTDEQTNELTEKKELTTEEAALQKLQNVRNNQ